jgi:nucleoid-associated protein YgaU
MATNPKDNSKTKASEAKSPARSLRAPIPVKKAVASPAKKKPAAKPKTIVKAPQKDIQPEKKSAQASAFDKKIDQMSKSPDAAEKSGKKKTGKKITIAAIIIIVLAFLVYVYYPKKSTITKEDITPEQEPTVPSAQETPKTEEKAPVQETKPAEPVKVEPAKKEVKPASNVVVHKVVYKDQLTEIAKKYYGSHKEWKRIFEANKDKINNPNVIFPGQEFVIPGIEKKD